MISFNSSSEVFGFLNIVTQPSITSDKLCGGILVAIPTAIPPAPFINKLGNLEGSTEGSDSDPS